jgi:hypothetical protein
MPRPVHFEIHADDPARAMRFYGQLFGWTFRQFGDAPYWLVTTGDPQVPGIDGGLGPRRGPSPAAGQPVNAYTCVIDVPDVDAALERAVALGGAVAVPKTVIPAVGWLAYASDTEGNLFGMMRMDAEAR